MKHSHLVFLILIAILACGTACTRKTASPSGRRSNSSDDSQQQDTAVPEFSLAESEELKQKLQRLIAAERSRNPDLLEELPAYLLKDLPFDWTGYSSGLQDGAVERYRESAFLLSPAEQRSLLLSNEQLSGDSGETFRRVLLLKEGHA